MADNGYSVIDTSTVPWEPYAIGNSMRKVLDLDDGTGGCVLLLYFPPGGEPVRRQLHLTVRETFFWLYGDFPFWEYDSPTDLDGHVVVYRRGTFMDRWPRSIHGRKPQPGSCTGSEFLIWTSGGGDFETDADESIQIPFSPDPGDFGDTFTSPIIIESDSLPWSPHPQAAGLLQRTLDTGAGDTGTGDASRYPISLVQIPPGWTSTGNLSPALRRCWVYGVHGSVGAMFDGVGVQISEGGFARWDAGTSVQFAPEPSDGGCTLLCVGHALDVL